eukprot:CAMPEP_0114579592 /NCGR_PEP_ID=MMETSP0125-20121206/3928_1 /TAXON_ID=485358 ORGANISM="Aristerostoma sp., Strain ATCC 50986" /NCGR_SAMPLE_ID=MMETSP0125 /ASSEMBLY_ACC=CAM_ASM_000245 /LENGTH=111 /DNA_ID=CAMNT_0001770409 /DNA_START=459 /DNA_END=794 /DNA_ORIENTATION=+
MNEAWTVEDSQLLLKLALDYKLDWKKVGRKFKNLGKNVTPAFLRCKYKQIKPQYAAKNETLNELHDSKLADLIGKYGEDWESISVEMGHMDPIKLRNRFFSQIKRKICPNK